MKKIIGQITRENPIFCGYASIATGLAFIQAILFGLRASTLTDVQMWTIIGIWVITVYLPLQAIISTTKPRY